MNSLTIEKKLCWRIVKYFISCLLESRFVHHKSLVRLGSRILQAYQTGHWKTPDSNLDGKRFRPPNLSLTNRYQTLAHERYSGWISVFFFSSWPYQTSSRKFFSNGMSERMAGVGEPYKWSAIGRPALFPSEIGPISSKRAVPRKWAMRYNASMLLNEFQFERGAMCAHIELVAGALIGPLIGRGKPLP